MATELPEPEFAQQVLDKDSMHRLIDEMPDHANAILVIVDAHESTASYWPYGEKLQLWDVYGMLQWAMGKVHENFYGRNVL